MKLLIIGEAGLVGSENCKLFAEKGWKVISVDNYKQGIRRHIYFLLQKMGEKFRTRRSLSVNGFDETLRMHRCMYTSFRISKIAAGLYTQECAHYMV